MDIGFFHEGWRVAESDEESQDGPNGPNGIMKNEGHEAEPEQKSQPPCPPAEEGIGDMATVKLTDGEEIKVGGEEAEPGCQGDGVNVHIHM